MNNNNDVNKDRLYFTQCNDEFPLRCPECTSRRALNQCKVYHNFPSFYYHFKNNYFDILQVRRDEILHVMNCVYKAYTWNVFPSWKFYKGQTTTSSSLEYGGRPARVDVVIRMKQIASLLMIQSEHYPNFTSTTLRKFIKLGIGQVDERILKKYLNCITDYSKKDKIHGKYDVTEFCDRMR